MPHDVGWPKPVSWIVALVERSSLQNLPQSLDHFASVKFNHNQGGCSKFHRHLYGYTFTAFLGTSSEPCYRWCTSVESNHKKMSVVSRLQT